MNIQIRRWFDMKKKIALLIAAALIFLSSTVAFADFGDYAGDSDWGGGYDSDWGGGYDSDWDSDYSDDYYYGSSGGELGFPEAIIIVIILVVVFALFVRKPSGKNYPKVNVQNPQAVSLINDIDGLKKRDPNFNESKFLGEAANLYIRMQDAWTARDLEPIRTHLTEELYAKSDRQVKGYIQRGQTNHVERPSVLSTKIVGCTADEKNDIITVELMTRIIDYVTDDKTGNIIRGSKDRELFMTYRWTFIRTLGKLTSSEGLVDEKHCPNCGAPIDLNRSAVCEYCGSVCVSGDYNWVVSDIQGISQTS